MNYKVLLISDFIAHWLMFAAMTVIILITPLPQYIESNVIKMGTRGFFT